MTFIHDNFLLQNKTAERLYHQYAEDRPIIDYHCHLSPADLSCNRCYGNITEIWLGVSRPNGWNDLAIKRANNTGLLSHFVGMLTDSHSKMSYPQHEYFRRLLCNLIGDEIEKRLLPDDIEMAGELIRRVCYDNARNFFKFRKIKSG